MDEKNGGVGGLRRRVKQMDKGKTGIQYSTRFKKGKIK
jgi:hypothetical protein